MRARKTEINALVKDFLDYLEVERNLSSLTIRNYHFWLDRFARWLRETHKPTSVGHLNLSVIGKFRLWLAHRPGRTGREISVATQAYHIVALRSFLRWCAKVDIETISPDKIDVPKSRTQRLAFLSSEQLERLLAVPTGRGIRIFRDRAILEVLFSTGLRVSELVSLNRDQMDLRTREFSVIGKGGKARVVFLSQRAAGALRKYLELRRDQFASLFIRYGGKKPGVSAANESVRLTGRSVERLVEKYRKRAGLSVKITPHGLRHTFATDLLRGGADLRAVQELLGHKHISTTQIYTHVTDRQLKQVHERAHSGNK